MTIDEFNNLKPNDIVYGCFYNNIDNNHITKYKFIGRALPVYGDTMFIVLAFIRHESDDHNYRYPYLVVDRDYFFNNFKTNC